MLPSIEGVGLMDKELLIKARNSHLLQAFHCVVAASAIESQLLREHGNDADGHLTYSQESDLNQVILCLSFMTRNLEQILEADEF